MSHVMSFPFVKGQMAFETVWRERKGTRSRFRVHDIVALNRELTEANQSGEMRRRVVKEKGVAMAYHDDVRGQKPKDSD